MEAVVVEGRVEGARAAAKEEDQGSSSVCELYVNECMYVDCCIDHVCARAFKGVHLGHRSQSQLKVPRSYILPLVQLYSWLGT